MAVGFRQTFCHKVFFGNGERVQLVLGVWNKVGTAGKNFADGAYVAGYVLDAVQDHTLVIAENNVAVLAHQLHDQNLVAYVCPAH